MNSQGVFFPQSWIIVIFVFKRLLSMMVLLCTSEINLIHNKLFFFNFLKFTAKLLANTRCQITQISLVDMERFFVFLAKFNSCKMQSEMSSKGTWRVSWNEIYTKIIPFDVFRKVEVRKYKTKHVHGNRIKQIIARFQKKPQLIKEEVILAIIGYCKTKNDSSTFENYLH